MGNDWKQKTDVGDTVMHHI